MDKLTQIRNEINAVSVAYKRIPTTAELVKNGWDINDALKYNLESNKIANKIQNAIFAVIFGDLNAASLYIKDAFEKAAEMLNTLIRY